MDEKRVIELYKELGSINKVAARLRTTSYFIKKILDKNNIEIVKPKPPRMRLYFGKRLKGIT